MTLKIETFTNAQPGAWRVGNNAGGQSLFKALGHPLAAPRARELLARLKAAGPVAVYDPIGQFAGFRALYGLGGTNVVDFFVQNVADADHEEAGCKARLVTEIGKTDAACVFVAAFDAERFLPHIRHLLPKGIAVETLDATRIPDDMLTVRGNYLDPLNFATNFAFMKERRGQHTRVSSANYWGSYGAPAAEMYLAVFDEAGERLAAWREALPKGGGTFGIDSRDIKARFGLGDFVGTLFMHGIKIAGHDVVKYVVDFYGDNGGPISVTHDANAWPADLYAGLPAPEEGERAILWIQNSHPVTIPAGEIGFNLMGSQDVRMLDQPIAPFATLGLDVSRVMPDARWPQQLEVRAGRWFCRPRYELERPNGRGFVAHINVERTDLKPDPNLPTLHKQMGKGYILPMAVLPPERFRTRFIPTPMSTVQHELPIAATLYDASGSEVAHKFLGKLPRRDCGVVDVDAWLTEPGVAFASGYGHIEFSYDFRNGGEGDGWLHANARYESRKGNFAAETTFGAHIYNTPIVYRDEPQSYTHKPPGLTTRLFIRLGSRGVVTGTHLIYPASLPWHPTSSTKFILHDKDGMEITSVERKIACGGSLFVTMDELFEDALGRAGPKVQEGGYVVVRDTTCRLFGFHTLLRADGAFCFDHLFGF
ncbi:MAG TPA: hypothetical protein VL966_14185 [Alphaproteobacteria bacterium]|nr:hypothetical protein [Alphaproteobacteria bacterium]